MRSKKSTPCIAGKKISVDGERFDPAIATIQKLEYYLARVLYDIKKIAKEVSFCEKALDDCMRKHGQAIDAQFVIEKEIRKRKAGAND